MNLFKKLFVKSEDTQLDPENAQISRNVHAAAQRQRDGEPAMEVICGGCAMTYRIGIDSIIVTSEDVMNSFDNAEALKEVGAFSGSPDLVSTVDPHNKELMLRARARGESIRIHIAMKLGGPRKWRCRACDRINDYPAFRTS